MVYAGSFGSGFFFILNISSLPKAKIKFKCKFKAQVQGVIFIEFELDTCTCVSAPYSKVKAPTGRYGAHTYTIEKLPIY